jgi:hypothetical protein
MDWYRDDMTVDAWSRTGVEGQCMCHEAIGAVRLWRHQKRQGQEAVDAWRQL